ncbi:MAG: tol-pal system protein YbgF [Alphaproteobacteria bacterium]|nr:tol-pal system protein YbgF [Alphaproteobacteria bacterium]
MTIKAPTVSALSWTIAGLAFAAAALAPFAAPAQDAAALAKRVQQLEEQLVDMQVVVGTLESTNSAGSATPVGIGPAYAPPAGGGYGGSYGGASDAARLDGIETQIQALTAQMEQLSRDVRALSSGQRGGLASPPGRNYANAAPAPVTSQQLSDEPGGYGGSFGTTTVTPGRDDGIGGLLSGDGFAAGNGGGAGAKQMYETAYGYMLQQDYGAAEIAFQDFLKRYPNDPLSGNAQYWLGETYYLRGEYKTAASAFLEGYEKHRQNAKAPNSLLKLAMSLDRLGQRDAACSSYSELNAQYPNAPDDIRRQANAERRRSGC